MFDIKKFLTENKTVLNEASGHPLIKRLKAAVRASANAYPAPSDKTDAALRRIYAELEQALSAK